MLVTFSTHFPSILLLFFLSILSNFPPCLHAILFPIVPFPIFFFSQFSYHSFSIFHFIISFLFHPSSTLFLLSYLFLFLPTLFLFPFTDTHSLSILFFQPFFIHLIFIPSYFFFILSPFSSYPLLILFIVLFPVIRFFLFCLSLSSSNSAT